MGSVQYGLLHCHSHFSVRDSAMSIERLVERAAEMGAPAVALTDHGILRGTFELMDTCKEHNVKPIPGMEAYYVTDRDAVKTETRQHLILLPKDAQGYQAICDAVRLSYSVISKDQPCMDKTILTECFGPGADGHDHVIATTACMHGPIATVLLEDKLLEKSVEKLERQRDKYHPMDDDVLDAVHEIEMMDADIADLITKRDELSEKSKISLAGLRRRLKTLDADSEEYAQVSKELDAAASEKERLANELADTKKAIADKKRQRTAHKNATSSMVESAEKWVNVDEKIQAVLATRQGAAKLRNKAKSELLWFAETFGRGNFFVELQYHHIADERFVMPTLAELAAETGIPVVAANDAHYATNSRDDIRARSLVAAMRFNQPVVENDEGFGELYLRDDSELIAALAEIVPSAVAEEAVRNVGAIVSACNVEFEKGNHYPVFPIGEDGETAAQRLRRLANEGIPRRYPGEAWTESLAQRMEYELGIIDKMGYSDYLCIVQDFLEYGRSLAYNCPEKIGYTIGPGRGSAAGSIVCYLTGITNIDPMRYDLLFERFLNPERVSMPE